MKKYYGIGTWWKSTIPHQHFEEFVNNEIACIHASLDKIKPREIANRRRFRQVFNGINEHDIIYLKGYNIRESKVKVRAVGEVIPNDKRNKNEILSFLSNQTEIEDVFFVNVRYNKNHNLNGIIRDLDNIDDGVPRDERVYQETDPGVINIIDELMKK